MYSRSVSMRSNSSRASSKGKSKLPLPLDPNRNIFHLENEAGGTSGVLNLNRSSGLPLEIQTRGFKRIVPKDPNLKGMAIEFYEMDQSMLSDVYKGQLKSDKFVEFNNYMTLTHAGSRDENVYPLVNTSASAWTKFKAATVQSGRKASHLYNLMLTVVPAVASNTPGKLHISFHDNRMEEGASRLFGIVQNITQPRVYLVSTGYSVPLDEFDFRVKLHLEGVPIKKGKTAVWARLGWNLDVNEHPVYIPCVPALASEIEAGEIPLQKLAIENMVAESNGMRRTSFSDETPIFANRMGKYLADQVNTLDGIQSANQSETSSLNESESEKGSASQPEISFSGPIPQKAPNPITRI
ncbi:movement protein [Black currant leaf chlorosis associated virus]|uniref:movement protein n=1 Tax=Black currant leaf chlorosis associated virus TaxID=1937789 RepID=UPI0009C3C429|nr:movement protein [Black currant leaf chlorosis associated virus]APX42303.1 movement protein [Black currant leaf chlorosis associated virus]ARH56471.1 movement protein [Black currant leaf chlorosis associated virus]